jgi:hypothetical protein
MIGFSDFGLPSSPSYTAVAAPTSCPQSLKGDNNHHYAARSAGKAGIKTVDVRASAKLHRIHSRAIAASMNSSNKEAGRTFNSSSTVTEFYAILVMFAEGVHRLLLCVQKPGTYRGECLCDMSCCAKGYQGRSPWLVSSNRLGTRFQRFGFLRTAHDP